MKILIVNPDLDAQTELLASELTKTGLEIEVIQNLHPLRLILNQYDLVHFIEPQSKKTILQQNKIFQLVQSFIAQTIGLPTVISFYNDIYQSRVNKLMTTNYHAITAGQINDLKKFRDHEGLKMILPYLSKVDVKKLLSSSQKAASIQEITKKVSIIIPVFNNFEELSQLSFNNLRTDETKVIYIDSRYLKKKITTSNIRKSWIHFLQKNPLLKNSVLFNDDHIFSEIISDHHHHQPITILKHLELSNFDFSYWVESYLNHQNILILNDEQATGFSAFWKHKKNCFIFNKNSAQSKQYVQMKEFVENIQKVGFISLSGDLQNYQQTLDLKINELTRLYTKLLQQKTSLSHQKSANMSL